MARYLVARPIAATTCARGVSALALAVALLPLPAVAQSGAQSAPAAAPGNAPTIAGDQPQSSPTADSRLPAGVPPTRDAGSVADTTPVLTPSAQDGSVTADAQPAASGPAGDIVVTGSRLTNGMRTPTPVTVSTATQLAATAPNNIADGLTRLPAFGASVSTTAPTSVGTTGTVGQNLLNLRGLGDNRNLVLLDGRRIVSNNQDFAVDINTLPSLLISRVDVVTGGASAAYGSDAVAGVVNFILDTNFTGIKGQVSGGISTYGDAANRSVKLAAGGSLLGGRLHVIASEEYFGGDGIYRNDPNPRTWFTRTPGLISNALSATPTNLVLNDIRSSIGTAGGLIYTGPLKGTQFLSGGTPAPFNYGYDSGTTFQSGGDGEPSGYGFTPVQERSVSLIHATYDVSNDVSFFGEFSYGYTTTTQDNYAQPMTGAANAFTIFNDNAYLPASVKAQMATAKITNFRLGRFMEDFPDQMIQNTVNVYREAVGLKGRNLFNKPSWNWDVTYSAGRSVQRYTELNMSSLERLYAASDAVTNPATGAVVCRSSYYTTAGVFVPGGTGINAGCVPINVLGPNGSSAAAIAWINGISQKVLVTTQQVVEAKLSGDFGALRLGGGPISFAAGIDYRRDTANQTSDALSQAINNTAYLRSAPSTLNGKLGAWRFGNFQPFSGVQTVKEAFGELGIPILENKRFAESLTADLAGRYTSYSLAGDVQTWKAGLNYAPTRDIRFRANISRDIRAPNLLELFNSAIQNTNNVIYPSSTTGVTRQSLNTTTGNPSLMPEKAITQTYGVVLTPGYLPRFSMSVDYYHIKIKDAIATITPQNEVDFCAAGQTQFCQFIKFDPTTNLVTQTIPALNLNQLINSGIDIEVNYSVPLAGHPLGLRAIFNNSIDNYSQAPGSPLVRVDGSAVSPRWKGQAQLSYGAGGWGLFLNNRFISAVKMDPNQVEGVYTNNNRVPAIYYLDTTITKDVPLGHRTFQFFLTIENLLDRDPPVDVTPPTSVTNITSPIYDRLGRYFTGGVRFKL